ncbi:hypothetical protein [Streptomyces alfalfae]
MTEININNQVFRKGDTVRFETVTLPENRQRDYQITAVTAAGIEASAGGFCYGFTSATAARIGITRTTDECAIDTVGEI